MPPSPRHQPARSWRGPRASRCTSARLRETFRVDADGNSLGPVFTLGHGLAPSVASDGRDWLVVWQSSDASSVRPQVLAAGVTANGDATSEVPIFANDSSQSRPSVAWSGAGY